MWQEFFYELVQLFGDLLWKVLRAAGIEKTRDRIIEGSVVNLGLTQTMILRIESQVQEIITDAINICFTLFLSAQDLVKDRQALTEADLLRIKETHSLI